jgi:DNA-binding transcriptional MerR regulator
MRIGELAQRTGATANTVRNFEEIWLLLGAIGGEETDQVTIRMSDR